MTSIRDRMKDERDAFEIFDLATQYARTYLDRVEIRNIYPTPAAIDQMEQFTEKFPANPTDSKNILHLLGKFGAEATVNQIGGRYFGFVNGSAIPGAQAAKWLGTIWDQNASMFVSSPLSSHLESVVERWLIEIFDLAPTTGMGLVSGTSLANIVALITARNTLLSRLGWDINVNGLFGAPELRIIVSRQAHSSIYKALSLAGMGTKQVELIDADDQGRIKTEELPEIDNTCIVITQAGNVNTGSFDDFETIGNITSRNDAWLHVDGAFGLWAQASTTTRYLTSGIKYADSFAVDGHKTLNTPYDCGIVLCQDKEQLLRAMEASADYILLSKNRDSMLFVPEMSRRSKVIELWASLKFLGKSGLEELVDGFCKLAQYCEKRLKEEQFEVLNEVVFNQVLLRGETEEETEYIINRIQERGNVWCGTTNWSGRMAIRISICSWVTDNSNIDLLVDELTTSRQEFVELEH